MAEYNPDKHCGADRKGKTPCTQSKGWGTSHPGYGRCKLHGGSTRNHEKAARHEIALRAVERFGLASVGHEIQAVDPRDVLAEELWRTLVTVRGLDVVVGELGLDVYGETFHVSGKATGEAKPHVLWVMWQEQRQHLARVSAEAAKAGVEARRLELIERFAQQVAMLLRAIFGDSRLALSAAQRETAIVVAAEHLQLTAGS